MSDRRQGGARAQGILVLLGVLAVGVAVGLVVDRYWLMTPGPEPTAPDRSEARGPRADRLPRSLEALDLTDQQRSAIRDIFRARQPVTDSVMQAVLPRLRSIRDSVREEIMKVLTEPQQQLLRERYGQDWNRGPPWGRRHRERDSARAVPDRGQPPR